MSQPDHHWMQRALELARKGRGAVEPNPLVGAVVVRDGRVVGEGWHEKFGEAHAEIKALAAAAEQARGADLYVTLEPCCHQGKTPPCTDAILAAGLRRVVAAMADPFSQVDGRGLELLRASGLKVELGLCEAEARRLNAPYLKLLRTGRPYVHAKWAMSLDGKIATRTGDSRWISSTESRRWVHELRGCMDAIVVGSGTVRADDPLLTARPPGPRTATRVVLTSQADVPVTSQIVATAREAPVLVVSSAAPAADLVHRLEAAGCEVLLQQGNDRIANVNQLLLALGGRRMTNILVEGGSQVLGSLLDARAIDEVHVFISPRLIGGARATSAIQGLGVERVADALEIREWTVEQLGTDLVVHGRF